MLRYKQYTPFTILEFEVDVWEYPIHKHNYYEVIFIRNGEGTHTINDQTFSYRSGDIFLLSPEDYHHFQVHQSTTFWFFKFTELVFRKYKGDKDQNRWMERIESIISIPNQLPGAIHFAEADKQHALQLACIIMEEHKENRCYATELVADGMSMLISIIARNICYNYQSVAINDPLPSAGTEDSLITQMLTYIRNNVYSPRKITLNAIAVQFGLSKNYVGIFFKKNTGETLQEYVLNYRLFLAENRLVNTSMTISDIADALGFTDSSHLNKYFKRKFGQLPNQYRRFKRSLMMSSVE